MKKIFIDCGANKGQSAKAWLKYVPTPQHNEWDIHCFEASKKLYPTLERKISELLEQFDKSEKNIICYNKAVWINDDGVKFHDMGNESSSTDSKKRGMDADKMKLVESINLSDFIQNFDLNDRIILKMDIEGGEYEIVPHLYETGALKYVDIGFFEFHATKIKDMSIEEDFSLLRMFQEEGVKLYHWSAEYTQANPSPYSRPITEESIIHEWKRKGLLG